MKHICFFTGNRAIPANKYDIIHTTIKTMCSQLIEQSDVTDFICGGALGFDMLAEETILELKSQYPHIKLHLFLPCRNQTDKWNSSLKAKYEYILSKADSIKYTTNGPYTDGCMQKRNRAMADTAQFGIAYCDRYKSGAYSTVNYAVKRGRFVTLITSHDELFDNNLFNIIKI